MSNPIWRAASAALAGLWLAACPSNEPVLVCSGVECGEACCTPGQVCDLEGGCCTPVSCEGRRCGTDGCGTSCGTCGEGTACDEVTWTCEACPVEAPAAFCRRAGEAGKACGVVHLPDLCAGADRAEDCGGCANGRACAADNTCTGACIELTPEDFCAAAGKDCGTYEGLACGQPRTEECGACGKGRCVDNVCTLCTYEGDLAFCSRMAAAGRVCGRISGRDTCDTTRQVDCGRGACLGSEVCAAATNTCEACVPQPAADFCAAQAALGKRCGSITATDDCGAERAEDCGDDCAASARICRDFVCVPPGVPANDACAGAQALPFDAGEVATATGDTTLAKADLRGACSADGTGADVVFRFTVAGAAPRKVTASVTALGSRRLSPVLYLRPACATATGELGCGAGFDQAKVQANSVAPGSYYLVVDSAGPGYVGPFELTVALGTPDAPPTNDACADARDLTGVAMPLSGSTLGASDDGAGACGEAPYLQDGGDVVYRLHVAQPSSLRVRAFVDPATPGFHPALYLRAGCAVDAAELACVGYGASGKTELWMRKVPPGDYLLFVDGEDATSGLFQLSVVLGAPVELPDVCAEATALDRSGLDAAGNGTLTLRGDTSLAQSDTMSLGCSAGYGPDLVYELVLDAAHGPKDLKVTLETAAENEPVVYLRTGACETTEASDELGCAESWTRSTVSFQLWSLDPGTYYLWVDGYSGSSGPFTATVEIADPVPPAANDGCGTDGSAATPIALDAQGHGMVGGDTRLAAVNDGEGRCGWADGRDLVYRIDTTGLGVRDLTARVAFSSLADAVVYVWNACDATVEGREVACDKPYGEVATAAARKLPEGVYYIWVDQPAGDEGAFLLTVDAKVPPPSPCLTPTAITLAGGQGSMLGSTVNTFDSTLGRCGGAKANDSVFSFTTTAPQKVTVTATPDAASIDFRPVIYLRQDVCDSESKGVQVACAVAPHQGDAATATAGYLPAGTHFVWVDGAAAGTSGDFTVSIQLEPPVFPPANDTCGAAGANAVVLTLGGAPVSGDSSTARDDYGFAMSSGCYDTANFNAPGPDLVYQYTPAVNGPFVAVVTPTDWDPYLWVSEGACGGDGSTCTAAVDSEGTGGAESLIVDGVAGTTYFVYVDAYKDNSVGGPFTLEIRDLVRPTNDTCAAAGASAVPLTLGVLVEGDTTFALPDYGAPVSDACYAIAEYDAEGNDLVYRYTPAASGPFTVGLFPEGWDAYLWYAPGVCGDADACVDASDSALSGGAEYLTIQGVAGTAYFFYADRYSDGSPGGRFTIGVDPPGVTRDNDTCGEAGANAVPLVLGDPPLAGDAAGATGDYGAYISPACYFDTGYTGAGAELVYRYTPAASGPFSIEVIPDDWDPYLWYSIGSCGGDGGACVHAADAHGNGGAERLTVQGVAGTTYFIYVDEYAPGGPGPFTLQVK